LRAARESAAEAKQLSEETLAAGRAAEQLSAYTAALEIDYLSLFVGADETIGILITSTGERLAERIVIPKERLRSLMRQVDPGTWSGYGATRVDRALAPLVTWAVPHLTSAVLVISPDDPLHNLPFQYLEIPGGRLIDKAAIVKVHGADDVRAIAEKPVSVPERGYFAFVPARDEADGVIDRRTAFERLSERLPVPVQKISGEKFDAGTASRLSIARELLHLAAHGHWPHPKRGTRPEDAPNPYRASGVLLATGGVLPERREPRDGELLSPHLVMDSAELNVDGAVVVLQACVSGLSEEGRAGDALGLEWALLARGASTVLASHWDVSFSAALAFFDHFYEGWLRDGHSRAEACRSAAHAIRDGQEFAGYGLEWAAFTLIGDWR
jgi:CHAT domain-containing protein